MSDGIHTSQKESSEAMAQKQLAEEIITYLENPTIDARIILEEMASKILESGDSSHVWEIATKLQNNLVGEWHKFHSSSAFASQSDDFKSRFLSLARKRKIGGF